MRLLFLGPPGAGKGTQAERVAQRLGIAHVSTGVMFRQHVADGTELGQTVDAIMKSGDLVPDELTISMLEERIRHDDAADGYILDGFPRTLAQAQALDAHLGAEGLDAVVVLDVPEDELVGRMMSRGRKDDSEESIRNRLRVYAQDTMPLIAFYAERDIVASVDGVGELADITERILSVLDGGSGGGLNSTV
ncbi:MAG: adenylate kinase [Acidimicrobiia bacterium]|nr:adenylate kinase [Acidimicrobiia bacterium]NNF68722.1 adenylate kinase [Acidimicrobiia bacterium]NNK91276.1 adenylate kinase [Acidimicrobiia bacterium]